MKSNLTTIIKKELSRFFMDRKLLFSTAIMPGLMIFIVYTLMGSMFTNLLSTGEDYEYKIWAQNMPASIEAILTQSEMSYEAIDASELDPAKKAITEGELDLCLVFPGDFDETVAGYDSLSGQPAPEILMYYNSGETASIECYQIVGSLLDAYESAFTNKFDINVSEDTYDLADGTDLMSRMMSALVPMLFLTLLFSGCCSIAPDFIAGEKERGTIATLLVTPMKRSSLALGKIISMSVMTLLSGISSFLGVALSLPKLANIDDTELFDFSGLGFAEYGLLLLLVLSVVLVLISILSLVSAHAKSVKESATLIGPMNIIIMVIGIAGGYMGAVDNSVATSLVPVYNFAKCMSAILSGNINSACIAITIVSNLIYMAAATYVLTRMFNSERVMFSN
ncbi:MAG: ABC transporter permease [Muribaculaceae bacterium]|nr:ABC transporter permease [Roseburia sp.]MCM1432146.1 ABC transporter permease [Muribaculaceae bacterium]MCM1493635.1 ABC transporter permease [Muribaculaceae bacterium]MCM1560188.1 ABC transporter permease [Butyrivibrio sp.]